MRAISRTLEFCALLAVIALPQPGNTAVLKDQSGYRAQALADDDRYVRHGAITNIATCLTVADDAAAVDLWRNLSPEVRTSKSHPPGRLLAEGDRNQPGFGTLLACVQIVRTWQHVTARGVTDQPTVRDGDGTNDRDGGSLEHGTLVIDLKQSHIQPRPLIRLLTSPGLLPPVMHGGVVIRNAVVTDTLLFNNLHLGTPLAFVNTKFYAGRYSKEVFNKKNVINRSITITNSRFENQILIADSTICGNVGIYDTRFAGVFELHDVEHGGTGCAEADSESEPPSFTIDSSSFEQSLRIAESSFRRFFMSSNAIQSILWGKDDFGAGLKLYDNDIGSLTLDRVRLAASTEISYNRIANDFFIWDYGDPGERRPDNTLRTFEIKSNRIGGGLGLGGSALAALPDRGPGDPFELNLMSNHVGNGSVICLPAERTGTITLAGSTYSGTLTLGTQSSGDVLTDDCNEAFQKTLVSTLDERTDGTYCPPVRSKPARWLVELMATEIRTLQWHLPLDCEHRWSGFGLTYKLWLPDRDPRDGPADRDWQETAFQAWRTSLAGYEPAPLHTMSQYLASNGAYVPSRMIQTEAKRLNYAPRCAPHTWFWACLFGYEVSDSSTVGEAQAAAPSDEPAVEEQDAVSEGAEDEGWWTWLERVWSRFVQTVTLIFLFPAGYGAVPERALLCMAVGALAFGIIYRVYVERAKWRFEQARALLPPVLKQIERHISVPSHGSAGDAAEAERAQKVRHDYDMLPDVADDTYRERFARLVQEVSDLAHVTHFRSQELQVITSYVKYAGTTDIHGFSHFNKDKLPTRFTPMRYSIDTMLPVIDLHAYSSYYPEWWVMRGISVIQHIFGWWWSTVFIASAAIL